MDSRKRKPSLIHSSPLPKPPPLSTSSSSIFRDISNLKTPQRPSKTPTFTASPQFFTARKNTPSSSVRRGPKTSALKSNAARRLKAFELEQSKSARNAQSEKEKSLRSLARSLTVWLNFLFEDPSSCGCDPALFTGEHNGSDSSLVGEKKEALFNNGKRESWPSRKVGVDGPWRGPKRQRDLFWRGEGNDELAKNGFPNSMFSGLRDSLQEICSFEDFKERMRMYLSLSGCKEIFESMTQVTKNIDEGRLKMRASCPIVSDVGMKEKAIKVLMSYNPIWLRIGLYIILGGDSLLPSGNVNSEPENAFLRMVLEKQFFSHVGLAKAHAYNKQVEGLYRPGYYEKLGNIILKRFLLLVIIIDRAKCDTSLPLKYGIDGLDGGSPPMFTSQTDIKSSRQLVIDFLSSDVMHGEGNLMTHLVIVGYDVTYQQNPLVEYDFRISDLFEDLRDGIRLCRAIGLLQHDSSILMKMVVPSDTQKKSLINCGIALQYVRQAGVLLLDEDGTEIIVEDVVNGDKELMLSLLWNMFVNLQLPLLINKSLISEEISDIRGVVDNSSTQMPLDSLLNWIQAVCETYELKVESHSSLLDGKAMWCLLDFYFRKEHACSCSVKDPCGTKNEVSIMSAIEYTDAVHNFILSQKLTSLLGNFPEVFQVSDILEHNGACNGKSVIVLLVFLSVQLLVKRNMDKLNFHKLLGFSCQNSVSRQLVTESSDEKDPKRDFKAIIAWWQDMAQQNGKCSLKPDAFSAQCFSTGKKDIIIVQRENAATIIQSHYRRLVEHRNYMRITNAALVLQSSILAWLTVKKEKSVRELITRSDIGSSSAGGKHSEKFGMYVTLMADRHYFVNLKKSIIVIQHAVRVWLAQSHHKARTIAAAKIQSYYRGWLMRKSFARKKQAIRASHYKARTISAAKIQSYYRGWLRRKSFARKNQAIRVIQNSWKDYIANKYIRSQHVAATKIQSQYRSWLVRKSYACKKQAIIAIQNSWKNYIVNKSIRSQHIAATKIQSKYRSWLERKSFACKKVAIRTIQRNFQCLRSRKEFLMYKKENASAIIIQAHFRGWMARREAHREKYIFVRMQSFNRGWMQRKELMLQKDAAIKIQSAFRCMNCRQSFISQRLAAIDIQRFIRGQATRRRILGAFCSIRFTKDSYQGIELRILLQSVLKVQKWWRHILQRRIKSKCAIVVQSHVRGWMTRKMAKKEKLHAVVIQSYWKGYLARKDAKGQLLDLRWRMQKSAANVDDSRRLINRLVSAVSELLNMRSVSGILHTCATLDVATELSEKCCEELVAAGAVSTLLKLIRSVSRSIPDQQVLKHALSTLRNLARYPSFACILVESHGCVETVFLEFLRNKEEGYFIASELLKRTCKIETGVQAIRKSPAILKRLNNLAEELTRKAGNEKRKLKNFPAKENTERRLREVVELLKLITKPNKGTMAGV